VKSTTNTGAARVASDGAVTQLGGKAAPTDVVTETDVQDPAKLARMIARVVGDVAALKRRFAPRRVDFHDITTAAGGTAIRLEHGLNGRVVWWPIDYQMTGATVAPILQRSSLTDASTLVLLSYTTGTVSIRVEEYG
jgi:hypothetical protein